MARLTFKYPTFACADSELINVTDEELAEWRKEHEECSKHNKEVRSQMSECQNELAENAIKIWGEDSREVRYIKNTDIPLSHIREFDFYKRRVMKAREDSKKTLAIEEEANKTDALIEKAINWLSERGKVPGTDYTLKTALKLANDLAFDEAVARRKEEISRGLLISFGGDDSCENCSGWNGYDKRCQCGNRRVSWDGDVYGDFFLDPIVYGQAY